DSMCALQAMIMFGRSGLKNKRCLENRSGIRANLDSHGLAFIKRGKILRHVGKGRCGLDLSRLLVVKFHALFVRVEGFAVPDVKVVAGHEARSLCRRESRASPLAR